MADYEKIESRIKNTKRKQSAAKKRVIAPRVKGGAFRDQQEHNKGFGTSWGVGEGGEYVEDIDYREVYRQTLLKIHQYEENLKVGQEYKQHRDYYEQGMKRKKKKNEEEEKGKWTLFIMEHEILVQVIIFLPLTLMALYIAVIEKGPLFVPRKR